MKLKKDKAKLNVDRFDLEQAILKLWGTEDDLGDLFEHFYEHSESITLDEHANALLGLQQLLHVRAQKTFDIFVRLVHEGKIK